MNPRSIFFVLAGVLIAAGTLWILASPRTNTRLVKPLSQAEPMPTVSPQSALVQRINAADIPATIRQQPGGPLQPIDPRWAERRRLLKEDPQYEWKTPIEFYGKVLDQDGNPVTGATVDINWTDMSPKGSSHTQLTTDGVGKFSVIGIRGKHMTVQVAKDGYYREASKGRSSYEYAGFWEPTYHEPDPNKPVIFHLRKKGDPAPLVFSEGKFVITLGTQSQIPMPQVAGAGVASPVRVTVFENDVKTRLWKAQISVDGGGIMPALEEFPFEAPTEGYQSSIDLDQKSPRPPGWQDLDEGGWFYIKTPQGYGLLKLRQMGGKRTLHYQVLLNSKGDTNLEPARP
jgi:Carboxypeptidase regulatory-like domain